MSLELLGFIGDSASRLLPNLDTLVTDVEILARQDSWTSFLYPPLPIDELTSDIATAAPAAVHELDLTTQFAKFPSPAFDSYRASYKADALAYLDRLAAVAGPEGQETTPTKRLAFNLFHAFAEELSGGATAAATQQVIARALGAHVEDVSSEDATARKAAIDLLTPKMPSVPPLLPDWLKNGLIVVAVVAGVGVVAYLAVNVAGAIRLIRRVF